MEIANENQAWALLLRILHSSTFGHRIELQTRTNGREAQSSTVGKWKGLGVPEPVLTSVRSRLDVVLTEHLVTRYGVAGELPVKWGGEPDPF